MTRAADRHGRDLSERLASYALQTLPEADVAPIEAHISTCAGCRRDLEALRSVVDSFAAWPTDVLRPLSSLWERLANRLGPEIPRQEPSIAREPWVEPEWEEVSPGISCKLLATDRERNRVSMLVRLGPGVEYPPHCHAGVEELHLLDGELWIDDRKLHPGDHNRADPGTRDRRVWSETGCTCVLVTSPGDVLE